MLSLSEAGKLFFCFESPNIKSFKSFFWEFGVSMLKAAPETYFEEELPALFGNSARFLKEISPISIMGGCENENTIVVIIESKFSLTGA